MNKKEQVAFIDTLENMRKFQKLYFKTRTEDTLTKSKALERELDSKIDVFYRGGIKEYPYVVELAEDMRAAQRSFFKNRNKRFLIAAKSLEAKVDKLLAEMKSHEEMVKQLTMF